MTVVVDASVAIKWVFSEPNSDLAAALLVSQTLLAPDLLLLECANVVWRRIRTGDISIEEGRVRLAVLKRSPVSRISTASLLPEALDWAIRLDHPVYDCVYLALAIARNAVVVTDDRRFAAAAGRVPESASHVRLLDSPPKP